MNALQGAEIRIDGPEPVTGRLIHVDREIAPGSGLPVSTRSRVVVLTAAGVQQFVLEDVAAIGFADPELQKKIATALQRVAAYRDEARRRLVLHVRGAGRRDIRVGYVVAMPLWKTSYRLSLPADANAATARLQGWAVLENMTGQAWQDVELTLLSGSPVTFRQALYESYYVTRPTVPVESGDRVLPAPDAGAVAGAAQAKAAAPAPPPAPAPAGSAPAALAPAGLAMRRAAPMNAASLAPAAIEAAEATEQATQIAFTLPYKVSAPAGQSLMLPLLDRELPARRIDLYQPSVDPQHPLAAVEMTNTAETGLPAGVLTLYQQAANGAASYVGDARLAAFPAGEKRLLSYAVAYKTTIDRDAADQHLSVKATVAEGVLKLTRMQQHTTTYRIKTTAPPLSLVIEYPRRPGWSLREPDPGKVEMTAGAYRIPVAATAATTAATVIEEQPIEETIALTDAADDRLDALVSSGELDPRLRQAMTALVGLRQMISRQRADLERLREQRARLVEDESRLRDNLTAIANEPAMRKRLLDKFNQTETAIDNATAAIAQSEAALAAAERDLATYIGQLNL